MRCNSTVRRLLFVGMFMALLSVPAPAFAATAPSLVGAISSASSSLSGATAVAVAPPVSGTTYAYTTSYWGGELTAVDVSNPAAPSVAGSSTTTAAVTGADNVTLSGGYAFVVSKNANSATTNDNGTGNSLTIFDVHTNPAVPALVGTVTPPIPSELFGAYGIAVSGNYAYVAAQGVINGQPTSPNTTNGAFDVIDISTIGSPKIVATIDDSSLSTTFPNALDHADAVAISGTHAYVTASYSSRLTVIDISAPTTPTVVASYQGSSTLAFAADVAIQGNYAYVADQITTGRLSVFDISNPGNPVPVGTLTNNALNGAYRVRVSGNFAYVASSSADGVAVVDISDPVNPRLAGFAGSANLNSTTGLDISPAVNPTYVVASSPRLPSERGPNFPPYPLQAGGPTSTGTVSMIQLDPNPIAATITGASVPRGPSTGTTANFTFAASDDVSTFRCSLDGASSGLCSGGTSQQYSGLGRGSHTFTVQAIDAAGNANMTSYTWTVVAAPTVSLTTPVNGAAYAIGSKVNASYSCAPGAGTSLSSCAGTAANGSPIDTSTAGPHTFTVTAMDADGGAATASATYTVTSSGGSVTGGSVTGGGVTGGGVTGGNGVGSTGGGKGSGGSPPKFSAVGETNPAFALKKTSKHMRHKIGTTFRFTLNESASLTLTFTKVSSGRKVKGKCVKPTSKNKHAKSCHLLARQGSISLKGVKGVNRVSFSGKIGRLTLKNGTYTLVIKAVGPGGPMSTSKTLTFTIVGS